MIEEVKCQGSKIKKKHTHKNCLVFPFNIDNFFANKKVRGKDRNLTCHAGTEEQQVCICSLYLTSTVDEMGG